MIFHNFDPKYNFGAVFERITPQIRSQKLPKPGAARPRAWFWDRIWGGVRSKTAPKSYLELKIFKIMISARWKCYLVVLETIYYFRNEF